MKQPPATPALPEALTPASPAGSPLAASAAANSAAPALPQKAFAITHASEISAARRHGRLLAEAAGLNELDAGRLAIIVTEAGTNVLKHAVDGVLILRAVTAGGHPGVELICIDKGPGIDNLARSMHDGVSTAGTAGTGLGAMRRLSDAFDIHSVAGQGTAIYVAVFAGKPAITTGAASAPEPGLASDAAAPVPVPATGPRGLPVVSGSAHAPAATAPDNSRLRIGVVSLPLAGEDACGDGWAVVEDHVGARLVVVDGLGHGSGAAVAAQAAVSVLQQEETLDTAGMVEAMHEALRPTRGAAVAVARLNFQNDRISCAGVGNVSACVVHAETRRQLVSHNGIVGHNLRKVQQFHGDWPPGALAIFCSDGIGTQWDLNAYPGLLKCHPALIAAVLYRDFMRVRDDATVLVVQRLN